uniref:Ig-like domain-containing protein n=1 Tax=Xenopus tropicalis TaxID=8364 RepID=L7N3C3_XENTR
MGSPQHIYSSTNPIQLTGMGSPQHMYSSTNPIQLTGMGSPQHIYLGLRMLTQNKESICHSIPSARLRKFTYGCYTFFFPDLLILQAPPAVHEGDSLSLRCHSRPGYVTRNPVFYKDNKPIGPPVSGSELQIGRVNVTVSGTYGSNKDFSPPKPSSGNSIEDHVAYIIIPIIFLELFSAPQIKVSSDQMTEGDHMTITCDTELRPHRATTELQFAFYRNGHNVQGFSLSNQYGVPSAQLEDSGIYTCEVQTPTGSVRKRSNVGHIHIQGEAPPTQSDYRAAVCFLQKWAQCAGIQFIQPIWSPLSSAGGFWELYL